MVVSGGLEAAHVSLVLNGRGLCCKDVVSEVLSGTLGCPKFGTGGSEMCREESNKSRMTRRRATRRTSRKVGPAEVAIDVPMKITKGA